MTEQTLETLVEQAMELMDSDTRVGIVHHWDAVMELDETIMEIVRGDSTLELDGEYWTAIVAYRALETDYDDSSDEPEPLEWTPVRS